MRFRPRRCLSLYPPSPIGQDRPRPTPDRLSAAVDTLAALVRRRAAGSSDTAAVVLETWLTDYQTSLTTLRPLQDAPPAGLTLLVEAAAPGLAAYAGQQDSNPDLIGPTLLACVDDPAPWQRWVPAWAEALERAR